MFKEEGNIIHLGKSKLKVQKYKTQFYSSLEMIQKLFEILKKKLVNLSFLVNAKEHITTFLYSNQMVKAVK